MALAKQRQQFHFGVSDERRNYESHSKILTNDAPNKFEVEQMVRIGVAGRIYHVSNSIARRNGEQCVHWIENFTRYDDVPFSQQTTSVLTFFVCKSKVSV